MEWGSTLIGALIVVLTTQIKDFFEHRRSRQKEAEQWERQKEAEESRRKREEATAERQLVRDIYHKCISRLSLIISINLEKSEMGQEEKLGLYKDTLEWLSLLVLYKSDLGENEQRRFQQAIGDFTMNPAMYALFLLDDVKAMAMSERILAPGRPEPKEKNPSERSMQVWLDESFRRTMAIEGKELQTGYRVNWDFRTITPSQRQKLWDMYYPRGQNVPSTIELALPMFDNNTQQVILKGPKTWKAKLDLTACSAQEIFNAWEVDFEEALELAEKEKAQSLNNGPIVLDDSLASPAGDP
jgi:hypothetical protein